MNITKRSCTYIRFEVSLFSWALLMALGGALLAVACSFFAHYFFLWE